MKLTGEVIIHAETAAFSAPPVSDFAPFLGQLKVLALPLVQALGVGPINVSAGDAAERGDIIESG